MSKTVFRSSIRLLLFFFVSIALCLSLYGCNYDKIDETSETDSEFNGVELVYTEQTVTYSENFGDYSFKMKLEVTETDNAVYGFESEITDADRLSCIEIAEQILQKLSVMDTISVYIYSDRLSEPFIKDNTLYTPVRDWQSIEFAADILLTVFGEMGNYGSVYGYAAFIFDELGITSPARKPLSFTDDSAIYDLNLLCFDNRFADSDEIEAVKNVAIAFVYDFIEQNGEEGLHELIACSGDARKCSTFGEKLSDFYQRFGLSHTPSEVLYSYGGHTFDYMARSKYAEFYVKKNWTDDHNSVNPLTSGNFLHENYSEIKMFFETNTSQMENYQVLFDLDSYNNSLQVVFTNSARSSYYDGSNTIYLLNIDSLMHEYIHSLTASHNTGRAEWMIEGFARYFSYKYDRYGIAFLNVDYNSPTDSDATLYVREYLDTVGRPIDMAVDFHDIENIAVYSRSYSDPNQSYVSGSSFVGYLVNLYGEPAVIDHVCSKVDISIFGGKTYSELVSEWNTHIEQTYSQYSKYR